MELRKEVRAFLAKEIEAGTFSPQGGRNDNAAAFARKVGAKGWIGMTWPKKYGGQERTRLERYVVIEEMLASPMRRCARIRRRSSERSALSQIGTERVTADCLPRIAKAKCTSRSA